MKKYIPYMILPIAIILAIITLCSSIETERGLFFNEKTSISVLVKDSICPVVMDDAINPSNDTIINGTRYFYALQLQKDYMLVCTEYNEKYDVFVNAQIMHKDTLYTKIEEDNFFYSKISPSPDGQYVFFVKEYETGTTEPDGIEVTKFFIKFHSASIYDVVNKRTVYDDYMGRGFGNWTNCNQRVDDEDILFDPEKLGEDENQ